MPDAFKMEPSHQPAFQETFTQDGYIRYRNNTEHQAILMQWIVSIGYSIYPHESKVLDTLIHNADIMMYDEKKKRS